MSTENENWFAGCGCLVVVLLFFGGTITSCIRETADGVKSAVQTAEKDYREHAARKAAEREAENQRQRAVKRQQEEARQVVRRQAETAKRLAEKEGKLRVFTVREAPRLWETYQALGVEITGHDTRIEKLRDTLEEFGKVPDQDEDFIRICRVRDEMVQARQNLHAKIEEAYLAACKYAATPGRKEYEETRRRILEDGLREAEAATRRFDEMRRVK